MKRMNKRAVFSTALTVLAVICIFTTAMPAMANASEPVVYFADAGESPGSVYKVENETESTYYTRTGGQLYNFAFSPEGVLYYSNANDYDLYKLEAEAESLVYHHDTWVRDVAFDSEGRIYFSEASGSGDDGYIYRLEDGVASLYYTVLLSDVGFWAGDFTFDQHGNLYLSNGNVAGANIYKVVEGVPQIVFSAPNDESIKGISFSSAENVFYASWLGGNIYQVDLSTGERELFYSNPDHLWLSDVFVELSTITGKVMYNGRPVTDYTDSPATIWARNENTGQAFPISPQYNTTDGTYSIPNVPPGEYGISVWIDDAEPFDGRPFPGDYRGWNSPVVVPAGQMVVNKDLPCEKTIHLTSPVDNLSEIGLIPPPYDTHYQQEMLFRWDAITEASSYNLRVDKYQSSPYEIIECLYSEETPNTQATVILDDSLENQHYEFHLYARNPSGLLVGKLMVVYSNGYGWDYRFRILSGGVPCEGDFNFDGDVDGSDLAVFAKGYATQDLEIADLNHDGYVNQSDLAVFAGEFGRTDCTFPGIDYWVSASGGSDSNPGTQDEPFKTIAHALNTAGENKIIKVLPGTYDEELGETFPLMLQPGQILIGDERNKGDGLTPTVIAGHGDFEAGAFHYASMVGAEGSRVSGFKIGADTDTLFHFAIVVDGITMQISDNTFKASTYGGVLLRNNGTSEVEENVFDTSDYGVYIRGCPDGPTIRNNTFLSMAIPIDVVGCSTYTLISGNTITGNGQNGIQIAGDPLIENNTFNRSEGYTYGALRCYSGSPIVRGNDFICTTAVTIVFDAPDLGTASEPGNNDFSFVSGVSLTHDGSATVYAIGNTWANTPPEEASDIVVNGTGIVVWGTGPDDHYP